MSRPFPITILHITPHLGGGVGKALVSLVEGSIENNVKHIFLLLEEPEKKTSCYQLQALGCQIVICPEYDLAVELIKKADIVQLEWWDHPATFQFLCTHDLPPMRLLVWCHQSGLFPPLIPYGFIDHSHRLVFTSRCSLEIPYLSTIDPSCREKIAIVSSGIGLSEQPERKEKTTHSLNACYIGTFNFSKLHPNYVEFLDAVPFPGFSVTMVGDDINREILQNQCIDKNKPNLLYFSGYIADISSVLATSDIFPYLLNPTHYGTAENALLEAMSAGVVPIVLNNPCEMAIIDHMNTGLIVEDIDGFSSAVQWLSDNPADLFRISKNASEYVRTSYSKQKMAHDMVSQYIHIVEVNKSIIDFRKFLGSSPLEWFLLCQRKRSEVVSDLEKRFAEYAKKDTTKGSINHFMRYFPDDEELVYYYE